MKKKFKEIIIDGKKYGWIIKDDGTLRIYEDKKVIYEEIISKDIDITTKLISNLIFTNR